MSRISVLGLGKLGSSMAACFAAKGHDVVGVDVDPKVVELVNKGLAPVYEPGLQELMSRCAGRLTATDSVADAVRSTDVTFIVLPTPSLEDGSFSLAYVEAAAVSIAAAIKAKSSYHVVVLTSTVSPGSTGAIAVLLEQESGMRSGEDFGVCYNPEFIALGSVVRDFLNPDLILIGEGDKRAGDALEACLLSTLDVRPSVARMNLVNAEIAKIAVNTYLTAKIAFANMLTDICDQVPGGDVDAVTGALGLDTRISPKYLTGGLPFGGPCFPRDNRALGQFMRSIELEPLLPEAVDNSNALHLQAAIQRVRQLSPGGSVAILGLTYKPGSVVMEESPSLHMAQQLLGDGYEVRGYDPLASEIPASAFPQRMVVTSDLGEAVSGADVIVLAHPDVSVRTPENLRVLSSCGARHFLDCWRLLGQRRTDLAPLNYVALGQNPGPDAVSSELSMLMDASS